MEKNEQSVPEELHDYQSDFQYLSEAVCPMSVQR